MIRFFCEHGGKPSMARLCAFLLIPAVYLSVWKACDWHVVTALVAGGIVSLVTRSREQPKA